MITFIYNLYVYYVWQRTFKGIQCCQNYTTRLVKNLRPHAHLQVIRKYAKFQMNLMKGVRGVMSTSFVNGNFKLKIEIVFVKHYAPNHMHASKDNTR